MTCEKCKLEIQSTEPYFWGRDGGEWHPDCVRQLQMEGFAIRGMWMNTAGPWEEPSQEKPT